MGALSWLELLLVVGRWQAYCVEAIETGDREGETAGPPSKTESNQMKI